MELLSIPAILALIEALKMADMPSKYAPIASIIAGVILGVAFGSLVGGAVLGLAASGLYSSTKTVLTKW